MKKKKKKKKWGEERDLSGFNLIIKHMLINK
jgi:hypothetical protein